MYSDRRGIGQNHPGQNLPDMKNPEQNFPDKNPREQLRDFVQGVFARAFCTTKNGRFELCDVF